MNIIAYKSHRNTFDEVFTAFQMRRLPCGLSTLNTSRYQVRQFRQSEECSLVICKCRITITANINLRNLMVSMSRHSRRVR